MNTPFVDERQITEVEMPSLLREAANKKLDVDINIARQAHDSFEKSYLQKTTELAPPTMITAQAHSLHLISHFIIVVTSSVTIIPQALRRVSLGSKLIGR